VFFCRQFFRLAIPDRRPDPLSVAIEHVQKSKNVAVNSTQIECRRVVPLHLFDIKEALARKVSASDFAAVFLLAMDVQVESLCLDKFPDMLQPGMSNKRRQEFIVFFEDVADGESQFQMNAFQAGAHT
jgi:hypothetical protein